MEILSFIHSIWFIIILLVAGGTFAYTTGKLTLAAAVTGVISALLIHVGAGLPALLMLTTFFILGTAATSYRKEYKLKMQLAELRGGKRKMSQVLANAGAATILAVVSIVTGYDGAFLQVMIAGSFASATGDTLSSELGNLYGKNYYNILTLRKDKRGLDGVISLEGTLFGIMGSVLIALIYTTFFGCGFTFFAIIIAGIAGNLFDSLLGALFERQGWMGNDVVNFLTTAFAALVAFLSMQ